MSLNDKTDDPSSGSTKIAATDETPAPNIEASVQDVPHNPKAVSESETTGVTSLPLVSLKTNSPEINGFIQGESGDPDTDAVMIGVEIFEEADLEAESNNKIQLYSSDGDATGNCSNVLTIAQSVPDKATPKKTKEKKDHQNCLQTPARLSLNDRIKCIRMCSRYGSYVDAQKAWKGQYGADPPCRKTMATLNKKFERTGSVADLNRSGRPKTTRTDAVISKVEAAIRKDPNKSIRTLSKELGVTQASVHRIKKEFEDKRNTLKLENKKLKEKLNDALKRIVILERRLSQNLESSTVQFVTSTSPQPNRVELLLASSSNVEPGGASYITTNQVDNHAGSGLPTFIALNPVSNHIPSVLRLQQPGPEAIHIITLAPSSTSQHQFLTVEDSPPIQLSIPNEASE